MYRCESWTIKKVQHQRTDNFKIVVLWKTLENPLDSKEIKPVNPKGNRPWIFIGRTDAEAEAPVLWLHDAKSQLTGKGPDAGKDWRQEERGTTEDEMVGWHHLLDDMSLSKLWELVMDREAYLQSIWLQRVRLDWATEQACGEAGTFPHQKWQWRHLQGIGWKWNLCSEKSAGQVLP